jgi:hypothetical protein
MCLTFVSYAVQKSSRIRRAYKDGYLTSDGTEFFTRPFRYTIPTGKWVTDINKVEITAEDWIRYPAGFHVYAHGILNDRLCFVKQIVAEGEQINEHVYVARKIYIPGNKTFSRDFLIRIFGRIFLPREKA